MKRRSFLKTAAVLGSSAALSGSSSSEEDSGAVDHAAPSPPIKNILLLVTDQHRADALGCYGNHVVNTPHIDNLARRGVRFTRAFTPTPVCTPARTCLQTGLLTHRHRLMFNPEFQAHCGGAHDPDPNLRFMGELLKERAWQLHHVGKWHIGTGKTQPASRGYHGEYYPGYGFPGRPHDNARTHPHYLNHLRRLGLDGFRIREEIRSPDKSRVFAGMMGGPQAASVPSYLADQAIDAIKQAAAASDSPFFLACNFWGPHTPYYLPEKHYHMYNANDIHPWPNFDCDLSDKPGVIRRYGEYWKTGWMTPQILTKLIARYYGYVTLIDEEIGRILKALEESGEKDKTLIVLTADHGGTVGAYRMWDKGFGLYDCITRIPLVVAHPSFTPSVSEAFVSLLDLAPTFLDLAGCGVPENLDGRSLLPLLQGAETRVRDDHIVCQHFGHQLPFWQRMVQTQEAKYIFNPTASDEYYDLSADPWEMTNLIDRADRHTLTRMREILKNWISETGDPVDFWAKQML